MVVPGWVSINRSDCKMSEVMIGANKMYAYGGFFIHGIIMFNIGSVVVEAYFKGKASFSNILEGTQFTGDEIN